MANIPWSAEWTAPYLLSEALYFPLDEKAFAPRRNERLKGAVEKMRREYGEKGVMVLEQLLGEEFEKRAKILADGSLRIDFPYMRGVWPGTQVVKLTEGSQRRATFWNRRAEEVLSTAGVGGLIEDPAVMLLTLGMGYWGDMGNLMVEYGYVGERLNFKEGQQTTDLYRALGVSKDDFVLFTHIKHAAGREHGLYNQIYTGLLDDPKHLTLAAYLKSYERIAALMEVNPKLGRIVSPGSWFFDPGLVEVEPRLAWVQEVAGRMVPVGLAKETAPKQLEFALAGSSRRREAYESGKYDPVVTARVISYSEIEDVLAKRRSLLEKYA